MSRPWITDVLRRTPGEEAFDRCFFPLAAFCSGGIVAVALWAASPSSQSSSGGDVGEVAHALAWPIWVLFAVGGVTVFFWFRALASVLGAWRDPSARVLRFAALGLLIPTAFASVRLLSLPFF